MSLWTNHPRHFDDGGVPAAYSPKCSMALVAGPPRRDENKEEEEEEEEEVAWL